MDIDIKIEFEDIKGSSILLDDSTTETAALNGGKKDNMNGSIPSQEVKINIKAKRPVCFQCKICPYNTLREPFLDRHILQKHGFSKVTFEKEDGNDNMDIKVIKHNGTMVKGKVKFESGDECNDTEFASETCDFKTTHQKFHRDEEKEAYQCTQCPFETEKVDSLGEHEKIHKKLILFDCPKCDYSARQKSHLKVHMRVHEDPGKLEKFNCAICKKFVSFQYSALLRHNEMKHGTNKIILKCDRCSFTTKIQRRLTNHKKFHEGHDDNPLFKCEKCDFISHNEQTIQRHVWRHQERQRDGEEIIVTEPGGEKEIVWFCCNMCEFRSKDQRYVILHKKVHARVDQINKIGKSIVQATELKMESSEETS